MPKLISDLAIMLLTAGVVAVVFKRFRLPLVLGYILAGFLVGPYMPLFFTVEDKASIEVWSEIGIIVMMFGLGLEFNLHKLVPVGSTAVLTALTEVLGMFVLGYLAGQAMGWSMMDSVFLGGMLSMSSTTIVIKVLDELGLREERFSRLAFGTLVIQDIAGIFMMIILSTVSVSKSISGGALALKLGMLVLYLALWLILGIYILPTLLRKTERFMNGEMLLISSLGVCFGMVLLADALGFSSALGAFLAGSLIAGTVHAERVEHLTTGVKDLFGSIFFLSVGMMIDPAMIVRYIVPILIVTAVTLAGKLIITVLGVLLSGQSLNDAVRCGCALAQIGEFAFIIASLGTSLGVIAEQIYPIVVAVSVITTLATPPFIKNADRIHALLRKLLPGKLADRLERYTREEPEHREPDGDWAVFLRRYVKVTLLFGVLIFGVSLIVRFALYPLLSRTPLEDRIIRLICAAFCVAGAALFVRPMLDLHSSAFTALWVKNRYNRPPLILLTGIRYLLIVLLIFLPLQALLSIHAVWLLLFIAGITVLLYRSDTLASAYISAETRFMANFNERALQSRGEEGTEWLDEQLRVETLACPEDRDGQTLKQLGWGGRFGVNVIRVLRGKKCRNIPSGDEVLRKGDELLVIGRSEDLRSLRLSLGLPAGEEPPTLRQFMASQSQDAPSNLYAYALPVTRDAPFQGKSIRASGLRETYDCMILGLQRDRMPILRPDVNLTLQTEDLIWVLGSARMAEKLLAGQLSED